MEKWVVQCMGEIDTPPRDFELSVVRIDNAHGRRSWGWGDETKIILYSGGMFGNQLNPRTPVQIAFAKKAAQILCDGLNAQETD